MSLEGKLCAMCDKGHLRKIQDEVEKGIYVTAFKCDKCGEIWYEQEIMEKIEAMHKSFAETRHLVKVGHSLAAILPASIVKKLHLKEKEEVYVREEAGKILIRAAKN